MHLFRNNSNKKKIAKVNNRFIVGKDGTFSLIPNNMLKKNVSAEGLIK